MPVTRTTNINQARRLANELSERVARRTLELGLAYEQLEQSAVEETRKYRNERRRCRRDSN